MQLNQPQRMPNPVEWSRNWSPKLSNFSGGTSSAESSRGGSVVISRFGEFSCDIGSRDELMATFPEEGLICSYTEDCKLAFVLIDLAIYFENFSEKDFDFMAKNGAELAGVVQRVRDLNQNLYMTVFPALQIVRTELWQKKKIIKYTEFTDDAFNGRLRLLKLDEFELAFRVIKSGDEMTIGLGEIEGKNATLIPISVSNKVDYVSEITSGDTHRFSNLADKIILNR